MNVIGNAQITSPSGKEETCILFVIDDTTVPFLLSNVTEKEEDYVFSFWAKTNTSASLKIGEEEIVTSTEWKRYKVNFTAIEENIKIFFNNPQTYYLYRAQLEKGNVLTDWKPSPEDINASLELKVDTEKLISEINASANVIRLKSNRLVVESDNLQIYEDGTLKTQRGEIGGFILHDNTLTAEDGRYAEIDIAYQTHADTEELEGRILIGNKKANTDNLGQGGIFVEDYDTFGDAVYTEIGNVLGGGIKISTEENGEHLHIDNKGIYKVGGKSIYIGSGGYGNVEFKDGSIILSNTNNIYARNNEGLLRRVLIENSSNQVFYGYDSREYSEGASFYDGHAIYLRSNTHIYMQSPSTGLSGYREYGLNRLLWSGASFMNASQTATLTESVSSQANGIILVFSNYSDGADNSHWHCHFVPKRFVATHPGNGISIFCPGPATISTACYAKYLYISDTKITGNDANDDGSTTGASGITHNNARGVLRYVIGV